METGVRYLRLLVLFDLPVKTDSERKWANRFRNHLKKNGFYMLQYSVYCRVCRGESVIKYRKKIKSLIPNHGHIRMIQITDKQFANMEIILGDGKIKKEIDTRQLLIF